MRNNFGGPEGTVLQDEYIWDRHVRDENIALLMALTSTVV